MPTTLRPYNPPYDVLPGGPLPYLAAIPLAQLSAAELRLLVRSLGAQSNHWQAEASRQHSLLRATLTKSCTCTLTGSPQLDIPAAS